MSNRDELAVPEIDLIERAETMEMRNLEDTPRDVWLRWLNDGGAHP
ncbi:MAG TPA: hypothetical protein VMY41_18435 [Thermohalobaculum sp.]|nr:hypothetical protein [Thermohalobaculum sp.]